jgi:mannose-1-phosphate guanylyltransferase
MKVIIFCGGYGTRMWPTSTKSYPKQFRQIVKGRSFFQRTVERFSKVFDPKDILVSTESKYKKFILDQAPEVPVENIILEPERRDSLGAIGLVAAIVEKRFPKEVMFFSWSDHFIGKVDEFIKAVKAASTYTEKTGVSVSINEKPTYPSIHNGWVQFGEKVGEENGFSVFKILRHIEKPDEETAKKFFNDQSYLIHTGYASWRSDLMLSYYKDYAPNIYEGLKKIMDAWNSERFDEILKTEYAKFDKVSVDYGLFEKLPNDLRLTMAVETDWKDAGTWELFYKAMLEKGQDNVIEGDIKVENIDSTGNLIIGEGEKMISIVGLKNIAVIDTHGALMVCNLDATAKVKDLFKKLEEENPEFVD